MSKKLQLVGSVINTDTNLTQSSVAADAKVVGDAINNLNTLVGNTSVSEQINSAVAVDPTALNTMLEEVLA